MNGAVRNFIQGRSCPSVVCQSRGPRYRWYDGQWRSGDELPAAIYDQQPPAEQARIERHATARFIRGTTARKAA